MHMMPICHHYYFPEFVIMVIFARNQLEIP
jgi:hypothetical protein